jgi:hypothetical protein
MTMTHPTIAALSTAALLFSGAARAQDSASPSFSLWRARAEQIPIGATVKLRTSAGERLTAVLLAVDDSGILVKPATRIPERSRRLPYSTLNRLDRHEDHVSFGKYIGVGAAIGGALFLWLIASAGG